MGAIRARFYPSGHCGRNTDICLTPAAALLSGLVTDLNEYIAPALTDTNLPGTVWICIDFGTADRGAGDAD